MKDLTVFFLNLLKPCSCFIAAQRLNLPFNYCVCVCIIIVMVQKSCVSHSDADVYCYFDVHLSSLKFQKCLYAIVGHFDIFTYLEK